MGDRGRGCGLPVFERSLRPSQRHWQWSWREKACRRGGLAASSACHTPPAALAAGKGGLRMERGRERERVSEWKGSSDILLSIEYLPSQLLPESSDADSAVWGRRRGSPRGAE